MKMAQQIFLVSVYQFDFSLISLLLLLFLWSVDRHLAGVVLADNRRDIPFFRSFPFYEQNITEMENIFSSFLTIYMKRLSTTNSNMGYVHNSYLSFS